MQNLDLNIEALESIEAPSWGEFLAGVAVGAAVGTGALLLGIAIT